MADDLTVTIARVLSEHRRPSDPDGPPEQLCACGFTSDYLISDEFYNSITWPTDDAIEAAAYERVDREIEAHQAEAVRAVVDVDGLRAEVERLVGERNDLLVRDAAEVDGRILRLADRMRTERDAAVRDLAALRAGVALAVDEPIHLDDTNDGCVPVKRLRALLADPTPEVP